MTFTFNTLVSTVQLEAEDDSAEFNNYIPVAIDLAEQRLTRDLDYYGLNIYTSAALSANSFLASKPNGTLIIQSFGIVTSAGYKDLLKRTEEFCRDYWPMVTSVGVPKYYAEHGTSQVYIVPTPVSGYIAKFKTVQRPTPLSSANPTNFFTTYASDALFQATMVELMIFAKNPSMEQRFENRYQTQIAALRNESRRTRRDTQNPTSSPAGGDNVLSDKPGSN